MHTLDVFFEREQGSLEIRKKWSVGTCMCARPPPSPPPPPVTAIVLDNIESNSGLLAIIALDMASTDMLRLG